MAKQRYLKIRKLNLKNIKGWDKFTTFLEDTFNKSVKEAISVKNMRVISRMAIAMIYERVKSGYGVSDDEAKNPRKKKLAKLKQSYIKWRQKYKGPKGDRFAPNLSNLTLTGRMLNSMRASINNGSIVLKMTNQRAKDLEEYASDGSSNRKPRPFFALTRQEQEEILAEFGELAFKSYNKNF